ncbi:hypothetical protein BMW23_0127 [Bodo saltans virus]|uniref:Uncharacterized protein n=1 Tax=Bodo saltans virus TaxID=2024608 RepID=A0A2H4UTK9_9VIRU|nr:hypothetical protein QJ851_gp0124 [Bodo saltans virus]ATZ80187.1 hypothetical protein BMW23_0127 [Bodo saltans virus]
MSKAYYTPIADLIMLDKLRFDDYKARTPVSDLVGKPLSEDDKKIFMLTEAYKCGFITPTPIVCAIQYKDVNAYTLKFELNGIPEPENTYVTFNGYDVYNKDNLETPISEEVLAKHHRRGLDGRPFEFEKMSIVELVRERWYRYYKEREQTGTVSEPPEPFKFTTTWRGN